MNSPLPQPSPYTCPNCGAPIEGQTPFCPRCGAALGATGTKSSSCLSIGAQILLAMVALFMGLFGACFAVLGGTDIRNGSGGMLAIGIGGLVFAGLCIWGIVRLNKR